jgi:hypothetical protein
VVSGVLTYLVGAFCVGFALQLVTPAVSGNWSSVIGSPGGAESSGALRLIGLTGITLVAGLAGFVAARMGKGLSEALATGFILVPMGVLLAFCIPGLSPGWTMMAVLVLTIPAARFGGDCAVRRVESCPAASEVYLIPDSRSNQI